MDGLGPLTGPVDGSQSLEKAQALARRMEHATDADGGTNRVAEEFSALLGTLMVKELRKSLPEGFFGKGPGSDVMEGWLDEHVGRALSDGWNLDVAGMVRVGLENGTAGEDGEA